MALSDLNSPPCVRLVHPQSASIEIEPEQNELLKQTTMSSVAPVPPQDF